MAVHFKDFKCLFNNVGICLALVAIIVQLQIGSVSAQEPTNTPTTIPIDSPGSSPGQVIITIGGGTTGTGGGATGTGGGCSYSVSPDVFETTDSFEVLITSPETPDWEGLIAPVVLTDSLDVVVTNDNYISMYPFAARENSAIVPLTDEEIVQNEIYPIVPLRPSTLAILSPEQQVEFSRYASQRLLELYGQYPGIVRPMNNLDTTVGIGSNITLSSALRDAYFDAQSGITYSYDLDSTQDWLESVQQVMEQMEAFPDGIGIQASCPQMEDPDVVYGNMVFANFAAYADIFPGSVLRVQILDEDGTVVADFDTVLDIGNIDSAG